MLAALYSITFLYSPYFLSLMDFSFASQVSANCTIPPIACSSGLVDDADIFYSVPLTQSTGIPTIKIQTLSSNPSYLSTNSPTAKPPTTTSPSIQSTFISSSNLKQSQAPTYNPSITQSPSLRPTTLTTSSQPTLSLTNKPTTIISSAPTISFTPSSAPTLSPSSASTLSPSSPPTLSPANQPNLRLSFHNGTMMSGTINLYNIFLTYSQPFNRQGRNNINNFAKYVNGSTWLDILSGYYQYKPTQKNFTFGGTRFTSCFEYQYAGTLNDVEGGNISQSSIPLSDTIIEKILSAKFNGTFHPNNIYSVLFNNEFSYVGFQTSWCGRHFNFRPTGKDFNVTVSLVGFPTSKYCFLKPLKRDSRGGPCGRIDVDSVVSTYAHEIAEAITDPLSNGWYGANTSQEIADLCNFNFYPNPAISSGYNIYIGPRSSSATNNYLIQELWQNGKGCVLSNQQLPSADNNFSSYYLFDFSGRALVSAVIIVLLFAGLTLAAYLYRRRGRAGYIELTNLDRNGHN